MSSSLVRFLSRLLCAVVLASALPVFAQPVITAVSPTAPQVLVPGQTVTLSVTATGATSYQWKRSGRVISGATASSYTVTGVAGRSTDWYQAVATNAGGSRTSSVFFVNVRPQVSQVVGLGYAGDDNLIIPADWTNIVKVAPRTYSNIGLRADGTLAVIGGDGPPSGLTGIVDVDAGGAHTLALKSTGTVVAWGDNYQGQASVPSGLANVVAIAAGYYHSLALRADGTVVAWGTSESGATAVPVGLSDVVAISAGDRFSLALRSDGTMVGWGANWSGQSSPPSGLSGVVAIAAGLAHSQALTQAGSVVGWPAGTSANGPGNIPSSLGTVTAMDAGYDMGVAVSNGRLTVWGNSTGGGTLKNVPAQLANVVDVRAALASSYVYVLREAAGDTLPVISSPPAAISAFVGQDVKLAVGASGGTALLSYQWRKGGTPITGATTAFLALPHVAVADAGDYSVLVSDWLGSVTSASGTLTVNSAAAVTLNVSVPQTLTPGQNFTLSATSALSGSLSYQWCRNGRPINGATNASFTISNASIRDTGLYHVSVTNSVGPVISEFIFVGVAQFTQVLGFDFSGGSLGTVPTDLGKVFSVKAGSSFNLALRSDGKVVAWGTQNSYGQLNVPSGLTGAVAIAAGVRHAMALRSDGTVVTWGSVNFTPSGLTSVVAIAAGQEYSLALRSDGTVTAWNASGLANDVPSGLSGVVAITACQYNCAALKSDGTFVTWGAGISAPPAGLNGVVELAAGADFFLALKDNGTVAAWGSNGSGQLNVPSNLSNVIHVEAGPTTSYALKADGTVVPWGSSGYSAQFSAISGLTDVIALSSFYHQLVLRDPTQDSAPTISQQPVNATSTVNGNATFSVTASGHPAPTYQWQRKPAGNSTFTDLSNGSGIGPVNGSTLSVYISSLSMSGDQFRCVVTNSAGSVTSNAATLTVVTPAVITSAATTTFAVGASNSFTVTATGTPAPTFSIASGNFPAWAMLNSATGVISGTPSGISDSPYVFTVRASSGSSVDQTFTLNVVARSHLSNFASMLFVPSTGLICDFTIAGTSPKIVLIRAVGPGLTSMFGISGALADPKLVLSNASSRLTLTENDDWGGTTVLSNAFAAVGAFSLLAPSKDAALLVLLSPGAYSVSLNGVGGATGTAIFEIFEYPDDSSDSVFGGFSLLGNFPSSTAADFVVRGTNTISVLTRALSTTVVSQAGSGAIADPRLVLYNSNSSNLIASNDNWNGVLDVANAVTSVGAVPYYSNTSNESGLTQSVVPGIYTAQVSSNSSYGMGAIEVYDVFAPNLPRIPWFITLPTSKNILTGETTVLGNLVAGARPMAFQWRKNGTPIPGATGADYLFLQNPLSPSDSGTYDVIATNSFGTATSAPTVLTVTSPAPATISLPPVSTAVFVGQTATFSVTASSGTTISYQWRKDGTPISLATGPTLILSNVQTTAAGSYDVVVTNAGGSVTSSAATLTVNIPVPPSILSQPQPSTLNPGDVASFSVTASGSAPLSYQWRRNGTIISGATRNPYIIGPVQLSHSGNYDVVITNPGGTLTSQQAALNVNSSSLAIITQPGSAVVAVNAPVSFGVTVSGTGPFSYQWRKNGVAITDATNSSFSIPSVVVGDIGGYSVVINNSAGFITSTTASLLVITASPVISQQPSASTVAVGGTITVSVTGGEGTFPTYQWRRNGVLIPGATNATFVIPNAQTWNAGDYDVVITNVVGTTISTAAHVTVVPRVLAVSARLVVGNEGAVGTFTVEGTVSKQVLLRAIGPGLAPFGVTGWVPDPQLEVYDSNGTLIAINNDWWTSPNASAIASAAAAVGGFALANGGRDAAVLMSFAPGSYSVRATGASGIGGIAYLELFDADLLPVASTLPFFAVRARMSAGDGLVVGGIASNGRGARSFLVRAIGPSLGLAGALSDPSLTAAREGLTVAANDNWDSFAPDATAITAATNRVAAAPLPAGSKDAAMALVGNLHSGAHTALIGAPAGTSGLTLLELHDFASSRPSLFAPVIVSPPIGQSVAVGSPLTLNVLAYGTSTLSYSWRKNGVAISGATGATYWVPTAQASDGGTYTVVVSNALGTATSLPAVVVAQGEASDATQTLQGDGYRPGTTVTISNSLTYAGNATSLGWSVVLPAGWSFVSDSGSAGDVKPAVGSTGTLGWAWQTPPASPVVFSYTVNVPADQAGTKSLTASAIVRNGASVTTITAAPNPLLVTPMPGYHSADTNLDAKISLFELTRVIELYNTRIGSTRTGCYKVDVASEDGFAIEPSRAGGAVVTLSRYHSADSNHDGQLSLLELTRVIELYNTRSGTVRTGAYHIQSGTEDGFAPAP